MLEIIQLLIIISAHLSAVRVTRELIKYFCYLTLVYKPFYSIQKCCANSALTIMNQGSGTSRAHPAATNFLQGLERLYPILLSALILVYVI